MNKTLIIFFTLLSFSALGQARVFAVHDGDSYKVQMQGQTVKRWVRLWGVDCPEVISNYVYEDQPFGRAVADSVRLLLKGKTVTLDSMGVDVYNRLVVKVYVDTINLSHYILQKGWGWYSLDLTLPSDELTKLKTLQNDAKIAGIGLWGIPGRKYRPSTWRRLHRRY